MSLFLAAIYDRFMNDTERACLGAWRRELISQVSGDVLEVGAGTGANLGYYGRTVRSLTLTEPDPAMRKRLQRKILGGAKPGVTSDVTDEPLASLQSSEVVDAPIEALPFPDASFDFVVGTLVLCSVRDPQRALAEIRRVLRPGGRFVFIEHVAAEDDLLRLRLQRRVEPLWKLVAGNCHITRRTEAAIRSSGYTLETIRRDRMTKAWKIMRPAIRGIARRPD
jgi:ubiquinone/menaquinone biosynthesis C-methylase UbiE